MSLDDLARRIGRTFQVELECAIKKVLMERAEEVIEEAAHRMARQIQGNIIYWTGLENFEIKVLLQLDGVQKAIEEAKK